MTAVLPTVELDAETRAELAAQCSLDLSDGTRCAHIAKWIAVLRCGKCDWDSELEPICTDHAMYAMRGGVFRDDACDGEAPVTVVRITPL